MKALVTGGVRSGKSRIAEELISAAVGPQQPVVYVATGPDRDDEDWTERVREHRDRRPRHWRTIETIRARRDLADVLRSETQPVVVDCLGTWLTGVLDELGAWQQPTGAWREHVSGPVGEFVDAVRARRAPIVLVTNEVGWGVVSEHRSGRVFADALGWVNQQVAESCDRVVLAVAGQAVRIKPGGTLR